MTIRQELLAGLLVLFSSAGAVKAWGPDGHRMVARLAVAALPTDTPRFLTVEAERLMFLNYEPDAWRDPVEEKISPALRHGHDPDHHFWLELFEPPTLPADRYAYFEQVGRLGKDPRSVGVLPWRAMELFQRIRVTFRQWRSGPDPATARFLEARIIDDAGILGHYIADAAEPLHVTVNHNGWEAPDNPKDYTRDDTLHLRFEDEFVRARIKDSDVRPLLRQLQVVNDGLPYIYDEIRRSHAQVTKLYDLEKAASFGAKNADPNAAAFVAARLADAASTLRDLWYTAYRTSVGTHLQ
ncbi:MAG TPA: hypothetical protein VKB88_00255 [Bryobacteraceae bacterium]|nr:hypothetical protein [Bryobacteraceae bacterium]